MPLARSFLKLVLTVALSVAFGIAERILQDNSTLGWYLANVAGVWLAVAFAFGALAPRRRSAILLGLTAELSALAGFYGYMHFGEHHGEPHGIIVFWTCCGLVAGPILGLVGYTWRRRRSEIAGLVLGAMFVSEAILLDLAHARPGSITVGESIGGVLIAAFLLSAARWRKHMPSGGSGGQDSRRGGEDRGSRARPLVTGRHPPRAT